LEEFPILEKNGQDQVLGRAAAGFDQNDFSFDTLPPHFDDSDDPASSLEEWECILPGYSTFYSVVFRVAIPFLLASIVFHQDWIKGNFPESHHLFYSRLFTSGIVQRLRSKVETGIFKNE